MIGLQIASFRVNNNYKPMTLQQRPIKPPKLSKIWYRFGKGTYQCSGRLVLRPHRRRGQCWVHRRRACRTWSLEISWRCTKVEGPISTPSSWTSCPGSYFGQFWIRNPSQRRKNSCQCSVELGQSVCSAWPSTSLPLKALTRLSWEADGVG